MANLEHQEILSKGVVKWNKWREANPDIIPDLSGCNIPLILFNVGNTTIKRRPAKKAVPLNLSSDELKRRKVNFSNVNFSDATLEGGFFTNANFNGANFYQADLSRALLFRADLSNCNFRKAYMAYANLGEAEIYNSNFNRTNLVNAYLCGTKIINCVVFGISAWGLHTDAGTIQKNLILEDNTSFGDKNNEEISKSHPHYSLMVDDLGVAQFIHFIKNYNNLGIGLGAMLQKGVLLLGKFKDGGKEILESIAEELRKKGLIPIIFDFDSPEGSNLIETITVLAGISRFIVANLNGNSVPAELTRITANFKRPIITYSMRKEERNIFAMFSDILSLDNVLYFKYTSEKELFKKLGLKIAEAEINFQQSQLSRVDKLKQKRKNA